MATPLDLAEGTIGLRGNGLVGAKEGAVEVESEDHVDMEY